MYYLDEHYHTLMSIISAQYTDAPVMGKAIISVFICGSETCWVLRCDWAITAASAAINFHSVGMLQAALLRDSCRI